VSFEQYATRHLPAMLGTARAVCADDALAEDLVQDVLIKLSKNWASISQMDAVDAYVRRMLVNEYLSWRRTWSRLLPFAEPDRQRRGAESTSEDFASAHAELDVLLREIRRLPARQRAVIGRRYFADLSDEQIADVLGCSQSTVRVHAGRALTALLVVRTDPSLATTDGGAS
jgi:RNA polymerase sigma factor (sigma-70 family)